MPRSASVSLDLARQRPMCSATITPSCRYFAQSADRTLIRPALSPSSSAISAASRSARLGVVVRSSVAIMLCAPCRRGPIARGTPRLDPELDVEGLRASPAPLLVGGRGGGPHAAQRLGPAP